MKVLLINGSPHEHGCTYTALHEAEMKLNQRGIETELLYLGTAPMAGCTGCGSCEETGRCVFDDAVNRVLDKLDGYDGMIVGSPVYYGSANGHLCAFLDRLFYAGGNRMAGKFAASVVSCRRGGATAAFQRLNMYFGMKNMPVVSSQYWNQVHGYKAEDVLKDEEGLQTVRTMAENMAWLIQSAAAGREAGVPAPVYEPVVATNFIR